MTVLFGVDIPAVIHSATQGQLIGGTIKRKTKNGIRNFVFEGAPGDIDEALNVQAVSTRTKSTIIIIANSIVPTTTPQNQDVLEFNSESYNVLSIETDSAEATYTCHVSKR